MLPGVGMQDAGGETLHKNHGIYFVPGLQRGLLVLEALATAGKPLTVTELARRMALTRSSVFRLVYTLRHMGFVDTADGSKSFALGARVLNIGFAYLASKDIIELARGELEALRDQTGVSTHLAIRDGREVLYLSCIQTRSGFLSNMNVGSRVPAYASPMGWLLLADLSNRELAALFADSAFDPFTGHTPRDLATLAQRVGEAAARGYVLSRGIMETGGSSISAPVMDKAGMVVASIDISGPDSAFELDQVETRYLAAVVDTARRISARLGYRHGPRP